MVRIFESFPGQQHVAVDLQFTEGGTKKFERFTRENLTHPMAVLLDGELRAAPRIFTPISKNAQITGVLTMEEAARMIRNRFR